MRDEWHDWLMHRRHADDAAYGEIVRSVVARHVDRVLDRACLQLGMTMVDVGAGEGVLAFRAIERMGPSLRVILTDLSVPMLTHARALARQRGVFDQCSFLECEAETLELIPDNSVDVVVTRAVLAYVMDKSAALREFQRILKPGGRISIAEPVMQDEAFCAMTLRNRLDALAQCGDDRFLMLLHRWKSSQFPDTREELEKNPIVNYSERDLLTMVVTCGFSDIHLQLNIDVHRALSTSWDVFIGTSPHPWAPSLSSIFAHRFSADDRQFFEQIVRPSVEAGLNTETDRMVYIDARKPLA